MNEDILCISLNLLIAESTDNIVLNLEPDKNSGAGLRRLVVVGEFLFLPGGKVCRR